MPYSDNLYGISDDSDGNNYAGQLSPADGYFVSSSSSNVVPHIPNVMVPDPTLNQTSKTSTESKAREANAETLLNTQRRQASPLPEPVSSRTSDQLGRSTAVQAAASQPPQSSTSPYSQTSVPRTTLRTLATGGRTPSIYSDAPPAYTPSPFPPLSPSRRSNNNVSNSSIYNQDTRRRNYSTFTSTMGTLDVEDERLLNGQPESIGRPDDEEAGRPLWSRRVRRRLPAWVNWRTGVLAFVVLLVTIGLLGSSFQIAKDENKKTIRPAEPVEEEPQTPEEPETPDTKKPGPFRPTYCEGDQHRYNDQWLPLKFDKGQNITFIEEAHGHIGHSQVRVGGQVNVRRLDSGGEPRMVLEVASNDPDLILDVLAEEELQAMKVSVPKKYESSIAGQQPCVEMKMTIWVPEGGEIGILFADVTHLDVLLLENLDVHVTDYTRLSSVVGNVASGSDLPFSYTNATVVSTEPDYTFVPAKDSFRFDSRVVEVSTTSGRIDGNWPLYDMLGLHTTSGDINVSITPQEELESHPKPAVLSLSSVSGVVHATEPVHVIEQIPLRDYLVDIKSTSGGIHGAFAFGQGIELKSTASDIALNLLPVLNEAKITLAQPAQMETATTSGTTAVRVLEPVWFSKADEASVANVLEGLGDGQLLAESISRPFNCLQVIHKSTSGSIGLQYPQSWEGLLEAKTTSGHLNVKGKDVKIIKQSGWPGSTLEARKGPVGQPGSIIQVHALMGTMDAVIGDER